MPKQLTLLFRHYLTHGYISLALMLSTLIPLVRDKLGDITSSNNYRSIALSSLKLKVFDWVVLLLHEDGLNIDELQFGFQQDTSTNMCTWLAVETIEYFLRNGSDVFACVIMDMTKAFDKVVKTIPRWNDVTCCKNRRESPLFYLGCWKRSALRYSTNYHRLCFNQ